MGCKFFTIKDIEIELGVTRSSIMRWIKNGVIKTEQLPLRRKHIITDIELERFKKILGSDNPLEGTMPAKKRMGNTRLTTKDIADYCRVSKSTVLSWISNDRLKTFALPSGHNRIAINDFKEFLTKYNMPVKGWPFDTQ